MRRSLVLGSIGLFLLSGCDAGSSSADDPGNQSAPASLKGCTVDQAPPTAPGGYYTNGTTVCTADGTPHLFHGVARPSMEWSSVGENITEADFAAMGAWHANVVRIALNQDFWLSGAALYDPTYQQTVDDAVRYAEHAGLDVILDLHWSDRGDLSVTTLQGQDKDGTSNQQQMADVNSKQFWTEVATKYQGDGHVLFELYNEPNAISQQTWLQGGMASGFQVVGMQELYDTVRAAGANNVVVAGGLSYAFDLSGVGSSPIKGYNIMYASHPYKPQDAESRWESSFGYLATRDIAPVITTEFGDTQSDCTGAWDTTLIDFNDQHHISWTAWAWYPSGCNFPALISDWDGTTTVQGDAVKAALANYDYTPAGNTGIALPGGNKTLGEGGGGGEAGAAEGGEGGASGEGGAAGRVAVQ